MVKLNFFPSSVKNHIFIPKEVFSTYLSGNMKYIGYLNNGYLEYIQDMYYENVVKFSALLSDMLSGIRINFDWIKTKINWKIIFQLLPDIRWRDKIRSNSRHKYCNIRDCLYLFN